MKKVLLITASLFVLFFGFRGLVFAQDDSSSGVSSPAIYPVPNPEPGFLGQDHSYSVTFRGNGEAVVALKVALTNKSDMPLGEVTLRVPKVSPQEFFVYQVLREPSCIRYLASNICAETQEPDYYGYYWSKSKYQKAQSDFSGDTLKITLPQSILPNKSGGFFVYFRAMGYTKKDLFGAYKFTFETLKVNDDIRNLTVGISTDSDLVLRGATGSVNYRFEDAGTTLKGVGGVAPAESGAIDTFYNQIGYGSLIKTASSLAALESYNVSSSFANSRIKLYAKEGAIALGGILAIVAVFIIVIKLIFSKRKPALGVEAKAGGLDTKILLQSAGISFLSAFLVAGYTFLAIWVVTYLLRTVSYEFQAALTIFVAVTSFAVYSLFLFAPGVYMGIKKGIGWGVATVFLTVFWLVVLTGLGFLIFFLLRNPQTYPGPIPLGVDSVRKY